MNHKNYKSFRIKNYFIKIYFIPTYKINEIKNRLMHIYNSDINNLQKPIQCKIKKINHSNAIVKLTFNWINAKTLACFINENDNIKDSKTKKLFCKQIFQIVHKWKVKYNFIHGDISPNNILILNHRLIFIDWLLELKSFIGTPKYSSTQVYKGIHNYESDLYAASKIINELQ